MNKIVDKFEIYKENTVVLLGVGDGAKLLYQLFKNNKLNINYFCDNNKDNWGKLIENIPIISPPQLQQLVQSKNSQNSGGQRNCCSNCCT